jgi:hypothetical protein
MEPRFQRAIGKTGEVLKPIRPAAAVRAEVARGVRMNAQKGDGLGVGHTSNRAANAAAARCRATSTGGRIKSASTLGKPISMASAITRAKLHRRTVAT